MFEKCAHNAKERTFSGFTAWCSYLQPLEEQADRLGCKSQQNVFQQFKEFNKCCWFCSWNNYPHIYPRIYTRQVVLFHSIWGLKKKKRERELKCTHFYVPLGYKVDKMEASEVTKLSWQHCQQRSLMQSPLEKLTAYKNGVSFATTGEASFPVGSHPCTPRPASSCLCSTSWPFGSEGQLSRPSLKTNTPKEEQKERASQV